jgi:FkbM family methyltransferase
MRIYKDIRDWVRLRGRVHDSWNLIRRRRRPLGSPTCEIRFRDGRTMTLRSSTEDRRVFLHVFARDEYRLGWLDRAGADTVIDVGAHVGIFASRTAHLARRVVSFEPSPATLSLLLANVRGLPNVTVVPKAVSDRRGTATIHVLPEPSGNSLFPGPDSAGTEQVAVETLSLADVFAEHAVDRCDLLKLDCEGAEYPIVFGAPREIWGRVRRVAMEYHRVEGAPPAWCAEGLRDWLREAGHEVHVEPRGHHPGKGLLFSTQK